MDGAIVEGPDVANPPLAQITYADQLSVSLAAEHGMSPQRASEEGADPKLAEIGRQLAQMNTGLDCRQCHGVGAELPLGDGNTQLAPGINFDLIAGRLRPEFYRRFVRDPPRYDVATRMPKLVIDGRTTKIKEYFDGDAGRQFEALWNHIKSVGRGHSSTPD